MQLTHALVRRPTSNFAAGLTTANLGSPDYTLALAQHQAYCTALRQAGLQVIEWEGDAQYPDSCFVEDTVVLTPHMAIITRPGAASRRGETLAIANYFAAFRQIVHIEAPGTLDGGDVLQVGHTFFIGLSERTNEAGARQLAELVQREGFHTRLVPVHGVLHLKTGLTAIDTRHFVGTSWFAEQLPDLEVFVPPQEEWYAANSLPINDWLLVPSGFPSVRNFVTRLGKKTIEVPMSEFQKMDGGLTCLSLRW